jgi:hypothetical protein
VSEAVDTEVARAWEHLRPFARRVGPEASAEELSRSWVACVGQLANLFAARLGSDAVAARFSVPADYAGFMVAVGGGWAWGSEYTPQTLWPAASVVEETAGAFREYVTERPMGGWFADEFPDPPDDGLWLGIGWYSDKHATLLCCDRRHPEYGCVIDHHDGHPWLNGTGSGSVEARSFAAWLLRQAQVAEPGAAADGGA